MQTTTAPTTAPTTAQLCLLSPNKYVWSTFSQSCTAACSAVSLVCYAPCLKVLITTQLVTSAMALAGTSSIGPCASFGNDGSSAIWTAADPSQESAAYGAPRVCFYASAGSPTCDAKPSDLTSIRLCACLPAASTGRKLRTSRSGGAASASASMRDVGNNADAAGSLYTTGAMEADTVPEWGADATTKTDTAVAGASVSEWRGARGGAASEPRGSSGRRGLKERSNTTVPDDAATVAFKIGLQVRPGDCM